MLRRSARQQRCATSSGRIALTELGSASAAVVTAGAVRAGGLRAGDAGAGDVAVVVAAALPLLAAVRRGVRARHDVVRTRQAARAEAVLGLDHTVTRSAGTWGRSCADRERERKVDARLSIGSMDQVEPSGCVPLFTKVPLIGCLEPLAKRMACSVSTKSSGCFWKHSSESSSDAGQRR